MTAIRNPLDGIVYDVAGREAEFYRSGAWVDATIGDVVSGAARTAGDKAAFIDGDRVMSFSELDEVTQRFGAGLLDIGLTPGDRVIFQMGTGLDTAIALLGSYRAGVVPVCSLPQHRSVEIGQLTQLSGARGYFVQPGASGSFDLVAFARTMMAEHPSLASLVVFGSGEGGEPGEFGHEQVIERTSASDARDRLAQVPVGPEDVCAFQLSGGSTGTPKIIPRFHAEYLGNTAGWMRRYEIDERAVVIYNLPLIHNAGQLFALLSGVLLARTTVLMPRPVIPEMLSLIERHRVTHALSIGPVAPQLLAYDQLDQHDLSSLRLFATMNRADVLERHIGVPCSNLFGITEGLLLGSGANDPPAARHQTQGRSGQPGDEVRLLEPDTEKPVAPGGMGELCFRGASTLRAYYGAPEATARSFTSDGFFRSGDMMRAHDVDGQVFYSFEGRTRDNVNRGGEKIGAEEVETFVSRHPAVADAKLVAMPDPVYGEKGCIYLILRPDHGAPEVTELADFLTAQGLAKFKCPERIEVVESFPVTRVGKLDKAALRADVREKLERESHMDGVAP